LLRHPWDAEVVMSEDGEGNGFSPLSDMSVGFYRPDEGGFKTPIVLTDELRSQGYTEENEYVPEEHDVPAICLWPVT